MTLAEAMAAYNPQALPQVPTWPGTPPYVPGQMPQGMGGQMGAGGRMPMMNPLLGLLMRMGGPGQQQQRTLASYSDNPYSGNNAFRSGGY